MTDPMDVHQQIHANSFLEAYERCINPVDQGLSIPALVCAALSAELGMKALLARSGNEQRGHDLKLLFEALPAGEREAISEQLRTQFSDWVAQLEKARDAFVKWRYIFEQKQAAEVNVFYVGALASAINARVQAGAGN